jgi:hypothetical protein
MPAHLRVLGPAVAATGLILGSLPAFAQTSSTSASCADVHFELANPTPGSMLEPGGLVVEGIALDDRATQGTGIDHVDFFLGNRDQGGLSVGSAVPGSAPGPLSAPGSFQTTIFLPNITGGNDLFGYAHSSVSGQEVVIAVPVAIGESPTTAGETSASGATPTTTESCMGQVSAPNAPAVPATTPSAATTTTTTTPSTATAQSMISIDVGNPDPGATILAGGYMTQGTAVDHSATSGAGIDRIDIFLDNRDEGGTFLTGVSVGVAGAWSTTINLPNNMKGLHSLWFYAHSSVSGAERAAEVPVTIS